jgi:hypothetical protein
MQWNCDWSVSWECNPGASHFVSRFLASATCEEFRRHWDKARGTASCYCSEGRWWFWCKTVLYLYRNVSDCSGHKCVFWVSKFQVKEPRLDDGRIAWVNLYRNCNVYYLTLGFSHGWCIRLHFTYFLTLLFFYYNPFFFDTLLMCLCTQKTRSAVAWLFPSAHASTKRIRDNRVRLFFSLHWPVLLAVSRGTTWQTNYGPQFNPSRNSALLSVPIDISKIANYSKRSAAHMYMNMLRRGNSALFIRTKITKLSDAILSG